jgi:DNA-binding GntR family transcriptional regulator
MTRRLLRDKIYDYVAKNVQNGVYTPEVKIIEESVAGDLGVSRTPVREALSQLALEGIVEKIPRRGFFVKKPESKKSKEVFEVLGYLDRRVAELVCPLLTQDDFLKLEEYIAKIDIAITYSNFSDYSINQNLFHEWYANKCPNRTFLDMLHSLTFSHIPHTYVGSSHDLFTCFSRCNEQHRLILDAFKKKDLPRLGALVEEHWSIIEYEQYL